MSNTPESKRQTLLVQAKTISWSFHKDVLSLLKEKSIDEAGLDTIDGYLKAIALVSDMNVYKKMRDEASREQHCVRCHDEFSKDTNGPDSCVIPHVFDGDDYQRWGYGLRYTSKCCGEGATVTEETPGNCDYEDLDRLGKCFKGYHTTSVTAVKYNGINTTRCKLEGGNCVNEYIGYDSDDDPVFDF